VAVKEMKACRTDLGTVPGEATALRTAVESYLSAESPEADLKPVRPLALIVPHAGYRYSGPTAGRGYATVRGLAYDRVILIGPSHRVGFDGAALPDDDLWRTPLGNVSLDQEALAALSGSPDSSA
jgi:AmmeMemoRadiSam system protein B